MDANRCLKANYLHPFLAKNSQFLPKSAKYCRWPKRTNFGDSRAKSRQISPISKKIAMLVQIEIAWFMKHVKGTKIQGYVPLEGYFCPF